MFFSSLQEAKSNLDRLRQGKTLVFTNGCFDLLHIGHIRYLEEAKAQGDILIVALNSDASVKKLSKGPERPLQHERDRADILMALECVDHTILFEDDTPLAAIEFLTPDVLVKGGDWRPNQIVGSEHVLKNGGAVKSLQFIQGRSTTSIVDKIKQAFA